MLAKEDILAVQATRMLHAAASVPTRALNPDALDDIMAESSLFPDLHFFNVDQM